MSKLLQFFNTKCARSKYLYQSASRKKRKYQTLFDQRETDRFRSRLRLRVSSARISPHFRYSVLRALLT